MSDNGRRRIVSALNPNSLTMLTEYFALLEMKWVSDLVRKLSPDNDTLGITTVTVSSSADALRRWGQVTPQGRYMTAVLVCAVKHGALMQMPQEYSHDSAHWVEWVARQLHNMADLQATTVSHDAIALVVEANTVMSALQEGLDGDEDGDEYVN